MTYRLSRKADSDLLQVFFDGVSKFGTAQAETYLKKLESTFELIATTLEIAHQRLELNPPVRVHPYESHLIIYQIEPDGRVLIIRVRHGREDWKTSQ